MCIIILNAKWGSEVGEEGKEFTDTVYPPCLSRPHVRCSRNTPCEVLEEYDLFFALKLSLWWQLIYPFISQESETWRSQVTCPRLPIEVVGER